MENTYLVHHGILGQKWGKKNGPPYPLDFSKLSAAERKEAKAESITKGDIKTASAYNNKNYYNDAELNALINRFDLNSKLSQKVSSLDTDKISNGLKKIDKIANTVGTVSNLVNKVGGGIESFNKVKSAMDKAMGVDNNTTKSTFSFNSNKLSDMLKNPDKYSDQDWTNVKNRLQTINNVETVRKQMSDRAKESKVDSDIEKKIKDIEKQNKKEAKKESKKATNKTSQTIQDVVNIVNTYSEDPNKNGWDFVNRRNTLRIGMK